MLKLLPAVLQTVFILLLAPGVNGVIKKFKALLQNRRGPSVLQPYRDLKKYFAKEAVVSTHSSWIVQAAPYLVLAAYTAAALQVPVVGSRMPLGRASDLIAFIYLLALARVAMALAALDTGSNFGGMGASRELAVSALVEPVLFLSLAGMAASAGTTDLGRLGTALSTGGMTLSRLLALAAFAVVAIAEMGRIPVDNPDTHLELTMIHEGMLLEYSGRHLALMTWAAQVKQVLMLTILADIFLGPGIAAAGFVSGLAGLVLYLGKVLLLGMGFGLVEFFFAKMRFFRLPRLLGASFLLSALSVAATFVMGG